MRAQDDAAALMTPLRLGPSAPSVGGLGIISRDSNLIFIIYPLRLIPPMIE